MVCAQMAIAVTNLPTGREPVRHEALSVPKLLGLRETCTYP